jgi:hypothetical protein
VLIEQLVAELRALTPHELYMFREGVAVLLASAKRELTPEEKAAQAEELRRKWDAHTKLLDTPGAGTSQQTLAWTYILRDIRAEYEELTGVRLASKHI